MVVIELVVAGGGAYCSSPRIATRLGFMLSTGWAVAFWAALRVVEPLP
jgi:hypothetical protein